MRPQCSIVDCGSLKGDLLPEQFADRLLFRESVCVSDIKSFRKTGRNLPSTHLEGGALMKGEGE